MAVREREGESTEARSRALDADRHQTAATGAAGGGGGQRPRAAEGRGSRGGWQLGKLQPNYDGPRN